MTNKPYVRYELSSKIRDKGLCFSIERTIKSYLENHNIMFKIVSLGKSSNHYKAILEIYEGSQDFNMKALKSHMENSGRLPSNRNIRPDIIFKPIPCDYQLNELVDKKGESWQKTCEKLGKELTEKEKEIKSLEKELNSYKTIDEKNKTNESLLTEQTKKLQDLISKKEYVNIKMPTDLLNIIKAYEMTMFSLRGAIETISPIKFQKCLEIIINRTNNSEEYESLKQTVLEAKKALELSNPFINKEEAQKVIKEFKSSEDGIAEAEIILEEFYKFYNKIISGDKSVYLDRKIESVNLGEKTKNRLKKAGIHTIIALSKKTEKEILKIEGIGIGKLKEIKDILSVYDMGLIPNSTPDYDDK